jgi:hypothetical protein
LVEDFTEVASTEAVFTVVAATEGIGNRLVTKT